MSRAGGCFTIPGPRGPGDPTYEIGFKHGRENRPVSNRLDETYVKGWADGHALWRANQSVNKVIVSVDPANLSEVVVATEDEHGIVATGGWCAPGDTYQIFPLTEPEGLLDISEVTARRGGISFTAVDLPQPTDEELAARRQADERARAERKAAGGEWRYAIRETDPEDGEVMIHDGQSLYEVGGYYLSAEEALEAEEWQFGDGHQYEVVRRWITDPPEWELAPTEGAPE